MKVGKRVKTNISNVTQHEMILLSNELCKICCPVVK